MTSAKNIFATLILIGLTGCMPKHENPPSPMTSVGMPADSSIATEDDAWPDREWWLSFNDPQLTDLIQQGLRDSPTLKKAIARVELAHQYTREKRSLFFPTVDADAQYNRQYLAKDGLYRAFAPSFPARITQIDLSLNFSYEIDFWGKNKKTFQAALGRERAERAEAVQSILMLTTAIAQSYFQYQANCAKKKVIEQLIEADASLLKLSEMQSEIGISAQFVPLSQSQNLGEIQKALSDVEKLIEIDQHRLLYLIGKDQAETLDLDPTPLSIETEVFFPKNLSLDLLARRPDLMAQIWRVEAAAKEIGVARTNFFPNLNLSGFLGYESLFWGTLWDWKNHMESFLPAIHLPIFEGGKLRAKLSAAYAAYDEAVYSYNDMVLNSAREVVDQLTTLKAVTEQLNYESSILSDVEQRFSLADARYQNGVSNFLIVLSVKKEWLNEQITEIDLLYARKVAAINLIKSLGGGYDARN